MTSRHPENEPLPSPLRPSARSIPCGLCEEPIIVLTEYGSRKNKSGDPQRFCGVRCRVRAWRLKRKLEIAEIRLRYGLGPKPTSVELRRKHDGR